MKIITRGEAMRIHQQHPASRLFPFCTGKYRWHGSTETYTGREVQDIPGVLAVFAERRKCKMASESIAVWHSNRS